MADKKVKQEDEQVIDLTEKVEVFGTGHKDSDFKKGEKVEIHPNLVEKLKGKKFIVEDEKDVDAVAKTFEKASGKPNAAQ